MANEYTTKKEKNATAYCFKNKDEERCVSIKDSVPEEQIEGILKNFKEGIKWQQ
jgi:hypothetical protein